MFFEQDEIVDELICPRCEHIFVDPRITPCYETICIKCIDELKTTDDEINCYFCKQKHKIPERTGFKSNSHLSKILAKRPRNINQCGLIEQFKIRLEKLSNTTSQLESNMKNFHATISQHCDQVRNQIDLCAEEIINEINSIRLDYISKINKYERECFENLDEKVKIFAKNVDESREFVNQCKICLKNNHMDDESIKQKNSETEALNDNMYKKLVSLRSVIFNRNLLSFQSNKSSSGIKKIFGDFIHTPLIDFNENSNFNGELFGTLEGHSGAIYALELFDDYRIATGSVDHSIRIWNIETGQCVKTISNAHNQCICCLSVFNSNTLASGSIDNSIKIWCAETGKLIKTLNGHYDSVRCMVKLNNDQLASGSADKTIKIWDLNTGKVINTLTGHSSAVYCLELLNDGNLASGANNIIIWNVDKCQMIHELNAHIRWVRSLVQMPNGNLVSCSRDQTIKIWNIETAEVLKTLIGHTDDIFSLALLNNDYIASGSDDLTIRIWNLNSGKTIKTINAHSDGVFSLRYFMNKYLISVSADAKIKIWK